MLQPNRLEAMIGADDFRRALGHFVSGVTIVATFDNDSRPTGLTASAFTSVSLDPPLILVCVHRKSQSYRSFRDGGRFAVNILRSDQEQLSRRFASAHLDRFDGVPYRRGEQIDVPLIDGALAQIECETTCTHVEGDHTIFVGRVARAYVGSGRPLLYFRGRYSRLQEDPA